MTKLATWMKKNSVDDSDVARAVKRSRVQINRIRRGYSASVPTAMALEKHTGIKWWHFVKGARVA